MFIGMFVYIDLIGYLPGAVAYRQARGGHIWHGFYVFHHLAGHSGVGKVLAGVI